MVRKGYGLENLKPKIGEENNFSVYVVHKRVVFHVRADFVDGMPWKFFIWFFISIKVTDLAMSQVSNFAEGSQATDF